jgi:hypothetical protein
MFSRRKVDSLCLSLTEQRCTGVLVIPFIFQVWWYVVPYHTLHMYDTNVLPHLQSRVCLVVAPLVSWTVGTLPCKVSNYKLTEKIKWYNGIIYISLST